MNVTKQLHTAYPIRAANMEALPDADALLAKDATRSDDPEKAEPAPAPVVPAPAAPPPAQPSTTLHTVARVLGDRE